ncbi:class I SAM-dependent methyltransferase [Pseudotamlana carrageenivorans]|uniref:Class I SAM-dependent methyltransferase n=1 Tax=Pseudotamlana carrageenivorans TaxID=2069432 RepID=A0A2I7SE13_9FLAO|nr:class I SAM-dependent methyltransferase [Tamlana carrageenivorans]AUS04139.1 class I SAM-dependent methyltransferase [Tamlana carrageenivorans]
MKDFINIKLNSKNLDRYFIRTSIFKSLKECSIHFKGDLLDIGCGKMPYKKFLLENSEIKQYIGLDIETALNYDIQVKPDYSWDGRIMPFGDESFDCAFGTEVLEHCPEPEVVLKEVFRVLKPGGVFFFTVPFLWNLHEVPNDEYRYTPFSLKRHIKNSGFHNIEIKATGGWHASMAQMLGLWVRRSAMSNFKRNLLSKFLKPVIKYLINMDNSKNVIFKEGQMITGLYGLAKK